MFNCRSLDGDIAVLRTDYRIVCYTTEHNVFRGLAFVVIALFSFGIPLYMVYLMARRLNEYSARDDSDRFVARRVSDELKIAEELRKLRPKSRHARN